MSFCLIKWGQLYTSYTLLSAIGEYDQTDTMLPLEHFRQHMPLLLVDPYIATSILPLRNEL